MKTVSCKIPRSMGAKLEAATAERDVFRSELLRAAIRYYVAANPDGYTSFEKESGGHVRGEKESNSTHRQRESESLSDRGLYDPMEGNDS